MKKFSLILAMLVAHAALAQDDNDVGAFDFDAADMPDSEFADTASEDPAATGTTDGSDQKADDSKPLPAPSNAVLSIIESDPKQPSELLEAIDLLIRLDRPDYAIQYLKKLSEAKLSDNVLVGLHRKFGTGLLLRLSNHAQLKPVATEFTNQVLTASFKHKRDEKRISQLVERLASVKSRREKLQLAGELVYSGSFSVAPLMSKLTDPNSKSMAPTYRSILVKIGKPAVAPVLSYLQSEDESFRREAMLVLGGMKTDAVLPYLARPLSRPSSDSESQTAAWALKMVAGSRTSSDLISLLEKMADLRYREIINESSAGMVETWVWDFEQEKTMHVSLHTDQAAAVEGSRLYGELVSIYPENSQYRLRHLIAKLEADKSIGGLDVPLRSGAKSARELAKEYGVELTQAALKQAMTDNHEAAAMAAAEVLGASKESRLLIASAGQPSVLAKAVTHANPRIRFYAAMAMLEIGFERPFVGIDRLYDSLGFFAGSTGQRKAVVAHPKKRVAQTIAGALTSAGIAAVAVTDARQVTATAAQSADHEFLFLSDSFNGPTANRIIQELRRDPKTARLPVGLLAGEFHLGRTKMISVDNEGVLDFSELTDAPTVLKQASRLLSISQERRIPASVRKKQAQLAFEGLDQINEKDLGLNLASHVPQLIGGLHDKSLALKATSLLGQAPSSVAQVTLLGVANAESLPWARRAAAFQSLERSIARHGLLLSKTEIKSQFKAWEANQLSEGPERKAMEALIQQMKKHLIH